MQRTELNQSLGIIEVFTGLGGGAVMIWIVWKLTAEPMSYVEANSTGKVAESNEWFTILVDNLPVVMLLLVCVAGIAWAVYQTELI